MSDDQLPGFIEDEPKPKSAPRPPAKQAAKPAAPAFDPFADVQGGIKPPDPLAAAPAAEPAFDPFADVQGGVKAPVPGAAPAAKTGTGRTARNPEPPQAADPTEADVRPGARKDLWACPHCGARNKPERETCRECGKSPHDEVVVPWHARPAARIGIGAGVLLVLVLVVMALTGTSTALKPAGPAGIDRKVRVAGSASGAQEIGTATFTARTRLGVSGRVLHSEPIADVPGGAAVVLALGPQCAQEHVWDNLNAEIAGGEVMVKQYDPGFVVLHLLFPEGAPTLDRGTYLSVSGVAGELAGAKSISAQYAVRVEQHATAR